MTVICLQHEKHKRRRACAEQEAERERCRALEAISHSAILTFEAGLINRPRDEYDSVRIYCAEEGHVGGHLPQFPAGALQGASLYLSAWATAIALAGTIVSQSLKLLQHAASLVSAHNGGEAWPLKTQTPGRKLTTGRGTK